MIQLIDNINITSLQIKKAKLVMKNLVIEWKTKIKTFVFLICNSIVNEVHYDKKKL